MASSQPAIPDSLTGVIAPLFTAVHEDGSLDLGGSAELVRWLADTRSVDGVFARSGMGKMFTFTVDEARSLIRSVAEDAAGRMHVLAGCAGEWLEQPTGRSADPARYTRQAIDLTKFAADAGADVAVHIIPHAIAAEEGETETDVVLRYYEAVHESTSMPLALYQPGGVPKPYQLTPDVMARLLEMPRIMGLKLSTTDPRLFGPIAEVCAARPFGLICGHEGYYSKGLQQGAVGVIGGGCMLYPDLLQAVRAAHGAGDLDAAARAQELVDAALHALDGRDFVVATKQIAASMSYAVQPFDRSGAPPCDAGIIHGIKTTLERLRRKCAQAG